MPFTTALGATPRFDPSGRASAEEQRRFDELYRQCYRRLVRLCRRWLGPHHDAEAVAQEAFVRAWESRHAFSPDRPFWPWLATIARRLCINDSAGRRRREELLPYAIARCTSSPAPGDEPAEPPFVMSGAARALRFLSPRHRRLIFLRDIEGWSYEEIARFEGVTVESVRSSLKRARETFRKAYREVSGSVLGGLGALLRRPWWRRPVDTDWWVALAAGRSAGSELVLAALLALLAGALSAPSVDRPAAGPVAVLAAPVEATPRATTHAPVVDTATTVAAAARNGRAPAGARPADLSPPPHEPLSGEGYKFVVSPSYEQDRTVFASGRGENHECTTGIATHCPALARSTDGGSTWTRLAARGWEGGTLMLPPAFPRDSRLFSASHLSLQVSHDGGQTFEGLTPIRGFAPRMSPLFSAGDPRILIGAGNSAEALPLPMEYRVDTGDLRPLSLPLPDDVLPVDFVFSPDYAIDRTMLVLAVDATVAAVRMLAADPPRLFRCDPAGCRDVGRIGSSRLLPKIVWAPGSHGTVFALDNSSRLYRSTDAGRSFQEVRRPGDDHGNVPTVAAGPDGRLFATLFHGYSFLDGRLKVSEDAGETWTVVQKGPRWLLEGLTVLPDGVVLAGFSRNAGGGIACSSDGARTWGGRCDGH